MERTLVILKPDAVQRRLVGRILARFEERGLQIVGLKMLRLSEEMARRNYAQYADKDFFEPLVRFMASGPVVALVVQGKGAVDIVRRMLGKTFGSQAEPGTVRGDFGLSNRFNLVHGSDSPETARAEIGAFFKPEELCEWTPADLGWVYDMSGPSVV